MPTLKKHVPQSESELHAIIEKELDALEEGLKLLKREYSYGKGAVDFLCVDSGGRIVIIEVKLHEDENILFQALRYYSDIDNDRHLVANLFTSKHVDANEPPRIILIAETFSEDIRRLSTLVNPDIELFGYTAVLLPSGDRGIVYHPVSLPTPSNPPSEPKDIDSLIDYLREDKLKPLVEKIRRDIKALGTDIEEYPTSGYIGYKHSGGRLFAVLKMFRKAIELTALTIDEKKQGGPSEVIRMQVGDEDYSEMLDKIKESLANLERKAK